MAADFFKKVKPRKGLIVRFPRTYSILPEKGGNVPWTGPEGRYWRRRVNCRDVSISESESHVTVVTEETSEITQETFDNITMKRKKEAK